jgi:hypothetical protein
MHICEVEYRTYKEEAVAISSLAFLPIKAAD